MADGGYGASGTDDGNSKRERADKSYRARPPENAAVACGAMPNTAVRTSAPTKLAEAAAEAENEARAPAWPTKLAVAEPEAVSVDRIARPPENAALALASADRVTLELNSVSRANSSAANSAPENSARGLTATTSYPWISRA